MMVRLIRELPPGFRSGSSCEVDDPFFRSEPAQLAFSCHHSPKLRHVFCQRLQGSSYDEWRKCINSCHTNLSTTPDSEGEAVASQLTRAIGIKDDVGRRVVWRRIHRIRTCKRP